MNNNFGYTPYYQQPRFQPIQQQMQPVQSYTDTRPVLSGKLVESIDVVKVMDIPMDGISYFPIADGSAIVTKQFLLDGTTKTIVYKPIEKVKEEVEYITKEDFNKKIENFNMDDIKDEIEDIKKDIKELKKKKKEE